MELTLQKYGSYEKFEQATGGSLLSKTRIWSHVRKYMMKEGCMGEVSQVGARGVHCWPLTLSLCHGAVAAGLVFPARFSLLSESPRFLTKCCLIFWCTELCSLSFHFPSFLPTISVQLVRLCELFYEPC